MIHGNLGSSSAEPVELAGNRYDPASKVRHSGHSSVNNAAGAE